MHLPLSPSEWQAVRQDWIDSELSLLAYQRSRRLASLMEGRKVPSYTTLRNHLACPSENITVHTLSEEEIQSAICPQALPAVADPADMPTEIFSLRSQSIVIRLPNGTSVEFPSRNPEFFALQILQSAIEGAFS